jgi:hypothetical protein
MIVPAEYGGAAIFSIDRLNYDLLSAASSPGIRPWIGRASATFTSDPA